MKKIVLLDFDGTIADTSEGVLRSMKYGLGTIGFDYSQVDLMSLIGPPVFLGFDMIGVPADKKMEAIEAYRYAYATEIFDKTGKIVEGLEFKGPHFEGLDVQTTVPKLDGNLDNADVQNLARKLEKLERGMDALKLLPGMLDLFKALKSRTETDGWIIDTGTSKPIDYTNYSIDLLNIREYFTKDYEIFGASMDDTRHSKKDVLKYALDVLGYDEDVDKAILIGDRFYDVEGATAVGIKTIGAGWGFAP
ncbi:MAG: HAD hydrolase-like protein, partial [Bifidobacteriaceae bacterium]|nr:HAD hydrolase-like protein [Bifidobacteriaceae bacterium]